MKTIFLAVLSFSCLAASARVFYIDPHGNDQTGNGSSNKPWKSLFKACSLVKTPGDTIFVRAGIYNEAKTSFLSIGVSIIGEGNKSLITSTLIKDEWTPIISLISSSFCNGNQSISYLKVDGSNLTAAMAIDIRKRNNVKIHNCTFADMNYCAVYWVGDGGYAGGDPYKEAYPPSHYVSGSEFHDNIVTNCSLYKGYGYGALYIGGHEGMKIYNNIITTGSRPDGSNGYAIKIYGNGGWMKGMKIFNNTLTVSGNEWLFAIEGFFCMGGEIYNNFITGAIDVNFTWKDTYEYGLYIHNNTLGPQIKGTTHYSGIILEFRTEDNIIERNHFRNCAVGIHHTMRDPYPWVKREKIRYNKFTDIGVGTYHSAIRFGETSNDFLINDLEINNNVFHSKGAYFGLHIRGFRLATNVRIKNNIFVGFSYRWFESNRGSFFDTLIVQNNILYKNSNYNNLELGGTPRNYIYSGNKTANPAFYSEDNFHPKAGSPTIRTGIFIPRQSFDLDGIKIASPPNIGCYESIASMAKPAYFNSLIDDGNSQLLILTFDMQLSKIVPDKSAFIVRVNLQEKGISSVEIIDGKVYIKLDNNVKFGDIVTVSYKVPLTNPLQSVTNVTADSFKNIFVLNSVKLKSSDKSVLLEAYPNPMNDSLILKALGYFPAEVRSLRILSLSSKVVYEKSYYPGLLSNEANLTIKPGIYIAQLLLVGSAIDFCRILVLN